MNQVFTAVLTTALVIKTLTAHAEEPKRLSFTSSPPPPPPAVHRFSTPMFTAGILLAASGAITVLAALLVSASETSKCESAALERERSRWSPASDDHDLTIGPTESYLCSSRPAAVPIIGGALAINIGLSLALIGGQSR